MTTLTDKNISGKIPLLELFDTKTMLELLTRDWFVDDEGIYNIIDCADQEAWDFIYVNRRNFSRRIREIIEPADYRFPIEKLRIKVRALSDKEWTDMNREKQRKNNTVFEKDWEEYSDRISDRPLGEVDSRLDDAWERLGKAKDKLTTYLDSHPKSYVPQSRRGKEIIDPKQKLIEDEIRKMKNEYDNAQALVEKSDSLYWETKKNEYRKTWMPKL